MTQQQLFKTINESPWINRVLLAALLLLGKEFYEGVRNDFNYMKTEIEKVRTDVEVLKREVQLLTDYNLTKK